MSRRSAPPNLADGIYRQLKEDIFEFRLLPGDRFSEGEVAERMAVSRTPVRQALHRLQREGYLQVHFRSGWQVSPLDLEQFEELYDLRILLELEAVRHLCLRPAGEPDELLRRLQAVWMVPVAQRLQDGKTVALLDEQFHGLLLEAGGNREMARVHREVSEKIRILRRLDFNQAARIHSTYDEHARILGAILERHGAEAQRLLVAHITASKAAVRQITLHMLQGAHRRAMDAAPPSQTVANALA